MMDVQLLNNPFLHLFRISQRDADKGFLNSSKKSILRLRPWENPHTSRKLSLAPFPVIRQTIGQYLKWPGNKIPPLIFRSVQVFHQGQKITAWHLKFVDLYQFQNDGFGFNHLEIPKMKILITPIELDG